MSGPLYVYAIADALPQAPATGLHGAPLRTLATGPLQAVFSEHALAPEPEEDLLWAHEQVVERLMEEATILPLRFGSTVGGPETLRAMLGERREEFLAALERVRGAVELSVRARLLEPPAQAAAEGAHLGERSRSGTAYLLGRARAERRGRDAAERVHRPLARMARRSVRAGAPEPSSFKAAYLVDERSVESFAGAVARLNESLEDTSIACTGPWPPYSFVAEEER